MSRLQTTVLIRRPVEDVWAFITDIGRYSMVLWGERYKVVSPGPLGVGSRLREADGTSLRVVEFESLRRFAVEADSPKRRTLLRVGVGHVLEPGLEGTHFTTWIELEFHGVGRVLRPVLVLYWRLLLPETVQDAKRYLEARPLQEGEERVATPARYNELVAAGAGLATWLGLLVMNGLQFAFQTVWILLIALGLGAWTLLRRVRFSRSRLRVTLGPWSREVDLNQLESIRWKDNTYGYGAQGTLYVRDRSGHRVPIEVGRFKRGEEWGPLLLEAAAASGAKVDTESREILQHVV